MVNEGMSRINERRIFPVSTGGRKQQYTAIELAGVGTSTKHGVPRQSADWYGSSRLRYNGGLHAAHITISRLVTIHEQFLPVYLGVSFRGAPR